MAEVSYGMETRNLKYNKKAYGTISDNMKQNFVIAIATWVSKIHEENIDCSLCLLTHKCGGCFYLVATLVSSPG